MNTAMEKEALAQILDQAVQDAGRRPLYGSDYL